MINEPVSKCTIVFKYFRWGPDKKEKRYYHDKFQTITQLREYFKRNPGAGALIRYGKAQSENVFAFHASLLAGFITRWNGRIKLRAYQGSFQTCMSSQGF